MMHEYLLEPFLTQYYLTEALVGDFMSDRARTKTFFDLARIFCLPEGEELNAYFTESEREHFKSVRDLASYERLCRTVEFARHSGQDAGITDRDRMILARKREAMLVKAELFPQAKNLTRETVASTLLKAAMNGSVDAMATLSYMEYHGICVVKDVPAALKRMRLCARWNHLFGNLFGIAADAENADTYYDTLYTVLKGESRRQIFEHIVKQGGRRTPSAQNPDARILEKAFGLGIVHRGFYDSQFARVAFSDILSYEDKKKLLLSKQKDAIAALSDIPFDLRGETPPAFAPAVLDTVPLRREDELRRILQNITVARTCPPEAGIPLLIAADDEYVADMYAAMLKLGFGDAAMAEIDALSLTEADFAPGRENIFLRSLTETKSARTVFLISHCEALRPGETEELIKVLDVEYRRRFKLFHPPVSLDLSKLTFILLASEPSAAVRRLSAVSDTVWSARIDAAERPAVVQSMFRARAHAFGCAEVTVESGCCELLTGYDTKQLQKIVDGALRAAIFEKRDTITPSAVRAIVEERNITAPRRGFGYTGGEYHA